MLSITLRDKTPSNAKHHIATDNIRIKAIFRASVPMQLRYYQNDIKIVYTKTVHTTSIILALTKCTLFTTHQLTT